jgi:hypothetical protein
MISAPTATLSPCFLGRVLARGVRHEEGVMSEHPHANSGIVSSDSAAEPYVVTRGKPPKETQFRKGQSGNPRGRPKGSLNFKTLLQLDLERTITMANNNGGRVRLSKKDAMARRLMAQALKGDLRAIEAVLRYSGEMAGDGEALPPMDTDPARETAILAAYLSRRDGQGTA